MCVVNHKFMTNSSPTSATPEYRFIEGFSVHPMDFALIARAAELYKIPLTDFVQLAAYRYAQDLLHDYATAQAAAGDDGC